MGCGDVGLRVAAALGQRVRLLALTSSAERVALLRGRGITPLAGDLDRPRTIARLAGLATRLVHLAPPQSEGDPQWWRDLRTQALLRVLRRRAPPRSMVYASTSGVYGDCQGARVTETRPLRPHTPRAQRRADAERVVRHFGRAAHVRSTILRIPGIYASDRPSGTPRERLLKGTPVLQAGDDVYTNHIHAEDLAAVIARCLHDDAAAGVYNACDDTELKAGDWLDLVADRSGLPRPPRVARSEAQARIPAPQLEFLSESRRLDNRRMKTVLGIALAFPSVLAGVPRAVESPA